MRHDSPLLSVKQLKAYFNSDDGKVKAVDNIDFDVYQGETVCIVGESGCGKSVTAMSLMGLLPETAQVEGSIKFDGDDLTHYSKGNMRRLRGNDLSMIFQEPMTSLNPVMTIGTQITEVLLEHQSLSKKAAVKKAKDLIDLVGIGRAEQIIKSYPHQLSGGMLQRVMIAIALACDPKMLIADEPTTALDVTIQAQVLTLLQNLKDEMNMSMLLITHDLGVVAEVADRVVVMYAGKVVEEGRVEDIFAHPKHPYTRGLLQAKPVLGSRKKKLYTIPGQVPKLVNLKPSCYFSDRCEHCMQICREQVPELKSVGSNHKTACWLYEKEAVKQ